jgi:hypothetical protein
LLNLFGQRRVLLQKNKCNIVLVHFFKGNCCFNWSKKDTITKSKCNIVLVHFLRRICYICFSVIVPFFDQIKQKFPLKKCTKTMLHFFFFNSTLLSPNKATIPLKNALKLCYGQRRVLLKKNKCNIVLVHFLRGTFALFGQRRVVLQKKNKCNIVLVHFFKRNCCFICSKKGTITKKLLKRMH